MSASSSYGAQRGDFRQLQAGGDGYADWSSWGEGCAGEAWGAGWEDGSNAHAWMWRAHPYLNPKAKMPAAPKVIPGKAGPVPVPKKAAGALPKTSSPAGNNQQEGAASGEALADEENNPDDPDKSGASSANAGLLARFNAEAAAGAQMMAAFGPMGTGMPGPASMQMMAAYFGEMAAMQPRGMAQAQAATAATQQMAFARQVAAARRMAQMRSGAEGLAATGMPDFASMMGQAAAVQTAAVPSGFSGIPMVPGMGGVGVGIGNPMRMADLSAVAAQLGCGPPGEQRKQQQTSAASNEAMQAPLPRLSSEEIADRMSLVKAANAGDTGKCRALLAIENYRGLNEKDKAGRTALLLAALKKLPEDLCVAIMKHPGFTEVNTVDQFGNTVLMFAASNGMTKLCRELLSSPEFTAINAKDKWGATALHWAADSNLGPVCDAIMTHKDFYMAHQKGFYYKFENRTALEWAETRGNMSAFNAIKRHMDQAGGGF